MILDAIETASVSMERVVITDMWKRDFNENVKIKMKISS